MWRMGQIVTQFSMQANMWLPWMCIFIPHTTYPIYYNWHLYKGIVCGVVNLYFYPRMMGSGLRRVWSKIMSVFEWIRMMIWYIWHWCLISWIQWSCDWCGLGWSRRSVYSPLRTWQNHNNGNRMMMLWHWHSLRITGSLWGKLREQSTCQGFKTAWRS